MTAFLLSPAGRLLPENVHARRPQILVEEHKADDHHRRGSAGRPDPHHPRRHQGYLNPPRSSGCSDLHAEMTDEAILTEVQSQKLFLTNTPRFDKL